MDSDTKHVFDVWAARIHQIMDAANHIRGTVLDAAKLSQFLRSFQREVNNIRHDVLKFKPKASSLPMVLRKAIEVSADQTKWRAFGRAMLDGSLPLGLSEDDPSMKNRNDNSLYAMDYLNVDLGEDQWWTTFIPAPIDSNHAHDSLTSAIEDRVTIRPAVLSAPSPPPNSNKRGPSESRDEDTRPSKLARPSEGAGAGKPSSISMGGDVHLNCAAQNPPRHQVDLASETERTHTRPARPELSSSSKQSPLPSAEDTDRNEVGTHRRSASHVDTSESEEVPIAESLLKRRSSKPHPRKKTVREQDHECQNEPRIPPQQQREDSGIKDKVRRVYDGPVRGISLRDDLRTSSGRWSTGSYSGRTEDFIAIDVRALPDDFLERRKAPIKCKRCAAGHHGKPLHCQLNLSESVICTSCKRIRQRCSFAPTRNGWAIRRELGQNLAMHHWAQNILREEAGIPLLRVGPDYSNINPWNGTRWDLANPPRTFQEAEDWLAGRSNLGGAHTMGELTEKPEQGVKASKVKIRVSAVSMPSATAPVPDASSAPLPNGASKAKPDAPNETSTSASIETSSLNDLPKAVTTSPPTQVSTQNTPSTASQVIVNASHIVDIKQKVDDLERRYRRLCYLTLDPETREDLKRELHKYRVVREAVYRKNGFRKDNAQLE